MFYFENEICEAHLFNFSILPYFFYDINNIIISITIVNTVIIICTYNLHSNNATSYQLVGMWYKYSDKFYFINLKLVIKTFVGNIHLKNVLIL